MSRHSQKITKSRLVTGVCVLLACFLAVGVWKAISSRVHKNSVTLPARTVEAEPLTAPSPKLLTPLPLKDEIPLLTDAVEAEDVVAVKALLEMGANPNGVIIEETTDWSGAIQSDSTSLLSWAVCAGNLEIVKLLLQHGANVEPAGYRSPLSEAAFYGHLEVAKLLLHYGADVNPAGVSPLAWATYVGPDALPMMKLLIRHGADVNARFKSGATAMSTAQYHSGDEAVVLLKRHGARR